MKPERICRTHDPSDLSYVARSLWTESKLNQGHKQKQCPKCRYWFFKCEWGKSEPKWKTAAKEKKGEQSVEKEDTSPLKLRVDADRLRLSEVLALKQLFRAHPGKSPIELSFYAGAKQLGAVHIEASWGVKNDRPFKEKLQALAEKLNIQM